MSLATFPYSNITDISSPIYQTHVFTEVSFMIKYALFIPHIILPLQFIMDFYHLCFDSE